MSIEKGHVLPCAFAQPDSLPVTLCQEAAIPLCPPSPWNDGVDEKVSCDPLQHPAPLSPELDHHLPLGG